MNTIWTVLQRCFGAFRATKAASTQSPAQPEAADDLVAKYGRSYAGPPDMIAGESKVVIEMMKNRRRGGTTGGT